MAGLSRAHSGRGDYSSLSSPSYGGDALTPALGDVEYVRQALDETASDPAEFIGGEVRVILDHRLGQAQDHGSRLDLLLLNPVGEQG